MHIDKIEKRNAIVCGVGNVLVWYNYSLFMPFLVVLSSEFFQNTDPYIKISYGFCIFALGLFSRPIGAYIFGRLGDKISREKSLGISIYLMAFSTVCIAILPSYKYIGIYSTIVLAVLRCMQGVAMGGASSVSIVHLVELFPKNRKCLAGSMAQSGMLLGLVLSSLMLALSCSFDGIIPKITFCRIAFFLGILLIPFAKFNSSIKMPKKMQTEPAKHALKNLWIRYVTIILLTVFPASCFYVLFAFLPNYIEVLYPKTVDNIIVLAPIVTMFIVMTSGYLSDKINKMYTLFAGIIVAAITSFCIFFINCELSKLLFLMVGLSLANGVFYGASSAFFSEMFPREARCTGMALSMSISQAIFGGVIPITLTMLASKNVDMVALPILFAVAVASLTLLIYENRKQK